jgi:hypothetical protein
MPKGCGECGNGAEWPAPQQIRSCSSAPIGAFSSTRGHCRKKRTNLFYGRQCRVARAHARGNLTEPHTQRRVPLGTIQVRTYLGDRPPLGPAVQINGETLLPDIRTGKPVSQHPVHRKEGFDELFEAVQLAERYDLAIMSQKV